LRITCHLTPMKTAEQVTFASSGLDRAAELRGDNAALDAARQAPETQCIVLWRGKLLVHGPALDRLYVVAPGHPILSTAEEPPIFLGRSDKGQFIFAYDISAWQPQDGSEQPTNSFLDTTEQHHPDVPDTAVFVELRRIMVRLSARDAELSATAKAVLSWHRSHRFCSKCGAESGMTQAGWQRGCDTCGAHHFPRTDPVVIMLITRADRTLLGRSPGWPEGMYSCLAGFIEPGETIEAAVRREVFEEAGVPVGPVRYLSSQPWAFPSSLMIGCQGEALDDKITIDPAEIDDAIWVGKSELMDAFAGQNPMILPARKGAIAHFLLRNWLADTLN
ncbi:MAG: NAD(+) diphosphatase, partial [Pseudomonadota bacterium]